MQKEIKVARNRIKIDNVPYYGKIGEDLGYVALTGFTLDAAREVQNALRDMNKKGDLSGIILDLRGNPGGRLDEAVHVSNIFLPQNETIVETRGRIEGSARSHKATRVPMDTQTPMVVLVDSKSASASEIVAGSLQDLDRAVVIGERSFGKGLVQNIRPLSYNTQLKITTAKYYTPSGRCIQAINYSERREDGSVVKIADSLKNAFQTRNGRTVYDGGGIEPDIKIDREPAQQILNALSKDGLIFEFATQFVRSHKTSPDIQAFTISDALYEDFVKFVKETNFNFNTASDQQLQKLQETIESEAYGDALQEQMTLLQQELADLKFNDILKFKSSISERLRKEIIRQYYYEDGVLESSLTKDTELIEAAKILRNTSAYKKILSLP